MRGYAVSFGSVSLPFQDTGTVPATFPIPGTDIPYYRGFWDCENCHWNSSANGFITQQLNRGNQLHDLADRGLLSVVPSLAAMEAKGKITKWYSVDDVSPTLEQSARSYLGGNCGYCHNHMEERHLPGQTSSFDYFHDGPPEFVDSVLGPVIPGRPDTSAVILRMKECTMPLAEVYVPDVYAINLIWEWINSLNPPGVPWEKIHRTDVNKKNRGSGSTTRRSVKASFMNRFLKFSGIPDSKTEIRLFSFKGRRIKLQKMSGHVFLIREDLAPGLYILKTEKITMPVHYFPF
jgi:hypothetical protein